jgi:DNA polymerase-4
VPRTIVHIDMNAFFASVEQMCNPSLRGKPLIICGDPDGRSVVSTASYEARKFGVSSGMSVGDAKRRCPDGLYMEGNPRKYVYYSLQLFQVYSRFTAVVEPFSIDEAFLDLSCTEYGGFDKARSSGIAIKEEIGSCFPGLLASVGIGPNKYIAKMASFLEKPDGLVIIRDQLEFRKIFWPMEVDALWGVGEKTKNLLNKLGIFSVAQLANAPLNILKGHMGENGDALRCLAWGEDDSPVIPYYQGIPAKSMGHEHTLDSDIGDLDSMEGVLLRLSDQVGRRLRKENCRARTICVKLRFPDFVTIQRQTSLSRHIDDDIEIFRVARVLLRENIKGRKVRLLGVTASNLEYSGRGVNYLFLEQERKACLAATVDSLKDKFGENILIRAGILGRRKAIYGKTRGPSNMSAMLRGYGKVTVNRH